MLEQLLNRASLSPCQGGFTTRASDCPAMLKGGPVQHPPDWHFLSQRKGMPAKVDMGGLKGFQAGPVTESCSSASSEVQQMGAHSAEEAGGLVNGAWSAEEDALLLQYVQVRQPAREGGSSAATALALQSS
jgi:hypothetical protein